MKLSNILQINFMNWLIENKEWVFSGGGIAIISALMFFFKKEKPIADLAAIQNRDNNGQQANNIGLTH